VYTIDCPESLHTSAGVGEPSLQSASVAQRDPPQTKLTVTLTVTARSSPSRSERQQAACILIMYMRNATVRTCGWWCAG
jgi:hypothetical protein